MTPDNSEKPKVPQKGAGTKLRELSKQRRAKMKDTAKRWTFNNHDVFEDGAEFIEVEAYNLALEKIKNLEDSIKNYDKVCNFASAGVNQLKARLENQAFIIAEQTKELQRERRKVEKLEQAIEDIRHSLSNPIAIHKVPGSIEDNANIVESIRNTLEELEAIDNEGEG